MVKIPELKDKQLIAQIHKYDKILKSLLKERKRRIASGVKPETLMTPKERQVALKMKDEGIIKEDVKIEASSSAEDTKELEQQQEGLNLSDSELLKAQEQEDNSPGEDEESAAEEEVRVTQLLQLSSDQIQEFKEKSKAAKKKKKKKKKGLFGL